MSQLIIPNRRLFLKSATAVGAVAAVNAPGLVFGAPDSRTLKIGLVGCGGRGTGAAQDAMKGDSNAVLWSMGDVFSTAIEVSIRSLADFKDRVQVADERKFTGMDAIHKVLASGVDVVILTTPPGFRPAMFQAAVEAGKHIFCEKPMAVDVPGVKIVMEAAKKAKEKGQAVVAGFCWRRSESRMEAMRRVLGGDIGKVLSYYATYYTGPVKPMQPASARQPEWSDVEWQVRNWYNFSWLSGDSLVEQAVHSVDKIGWAMGDKDPISCIGTGGRQIPMEGCNIFDHFSVVYEYPEQVFCTMNSRQQLNTDGENADYIRGDKGACVIKGSGLSITGENKWRSKGDDTIDMYTNEHVELFKSIRAGEPLNDGEWMCHSTLLAIMGRTAAYTGKRITWEALMNSTEDLAPDDLTWNSSFMPSGMPMPGQTPAR